MSDCTHVRARSRTVLANARKCMQTHLNARKIDAWAISACKRDCILRVRSKTFRMYYSNVMLALCGFRWYPYFVAHLRQAIDAITSEQSIFSKNYDYIRIYMFFLCCGENVHTYIYCGTKLRTDIHIHTHTGQLQQR